MTRERLHQLVDLILEIDSNGHHNIAQITISNDGDHEIYVYPNINKGGKATMYTAYKHSIYYDKNLDAGEARLRQMREGVTEC